ncbi:MAG: hypothetical protein AB7L90_07680 [Hyphomicrobiaceae bacterium]
MQLEPFAYHLAIADRLERAEPHLWRWFQAEHIGDRYRDLTRADLQERATRLPNRGANGERYAMAETACQRLDIESPVALFRLPAAATPGAHLVFMPDEVAIALAGNIVERITNEEELLAILGREIARFRFYKVGDGRLHIATRLLRWLVGQEGCPPEIAETSRRFKLMTEVYCDRGGLIACGSRAAAVRILFKARGDIDAEAAAIAADACLEQTDGQIAAGSDERPSRAPPEIAARARALAQSTPPTANDPRSDVAELISGPIDLATLDLLDRDALGALTNAILDRVLYDADTVRPAALAHAREIVPDYEPARAVTPLERPARALAENAAEYLAFLLLDFATVDGARLGTTLPVAAAAADELGIGARFREIARQELRGRRGLQAGLARRAA